MDSIILTAALFVLAIWGIMSLLTALIKPVSLLCRLLARRVKRAHALVKAKFFPVQQQPTVDEFRQALGEMTKESESDYRATAQADFEAAQLALREQLKKDPVSGDKVSGNKVPDEELAEILKSIDSDLKKVGFTGAALKGSEGKSALRYGEDPESKLPSHEDLAAQVEGTYHELDNMAEDIDELRQVWQKCSELLNSIMEEMGKKQYKLSGDDQFLADAEMSNQITRIATFTAKKTVESGLTQALPEMVRQQVTHLAEDELARVRGDVTAFLKLELHNAVKEIIDDVNGIDAELDEYEEDVCQLQEGSEKTDSLVEDLTARVAALEAKLAPRMAKLAKVKKPRRK